MSRVSVLRNLQSLFLAAALVLAGPFWAAAEEDSGGPVQRNVSMRALYQQGIEKMQAGRFDEAVEIFELLLSTGQNLPTIQNLVGVIYLKDNKPELATESFLKAIEQDPNYAESYYNLATVYMREEETKEIAENYYRKTVEKDPTFARAYFGLGWIEMLDKDNPEEAMAHFEKVTALQPDFLEGQYGLAMAYLRMNKRAMVLQPLSILRSHNRTDLVAKIEAFMIDSGSFQEEIALPGETGALETGGANIAPPGAAPPPLSAGPLTEEPLSEGESFGEGDSGSEQPFFY